MTALGEYYDKKPSPGVLQLYFQGLAEYAIEDIERAVNLHLRNADNGQFMPRIADLVKLIEGSTGDRAAMAWSKVHEAVKRIGPYQTVVFDDPLIHVVLADMGGFHELCDMKSSDAPFKARDFETRYRAYAARREVPPYDPKIIGITEADCVARGFLEHVPAPVMIGDVQQCKSVLAFGTGRRAIGIAEIGQAVAAQALTKRSDAA